MGNAIKSPKLYLAGRRRLTERGQTRRRIFHLTQAMNKAKNPEFKELWKRKIKELSKNL